MVPFFVTIWFWMLVTNIATAQQTDYYVDPTQNITCGSQRNCVIQCISKNACSNKIFTFLNNWGVISTKTNVSLICSGAGSCNDLILVANTSSIYLEFHNNSGYSLEAYINFGSSTTDIQRGNLNCTGYYSCESQSLIFNSMLDTDQGSDESETIYNGIVTMFCNNTGACSSLVVTSFQTWELNIYCLATHSCDTMTIYSPIKYHINYFDKNTNLVCDTSSDNSDNNNACNDVKIYQWSGNHLVDVVCNDNECGVYLYCGLMFQYNCNYFECETLPTHPCNGNIPPLTSSQIIASPNILQIDYTPNEYSSKEIYIYVSTLYEKFIYFYNQTNSNSFNAKYPVIYCPRDGSCNIICTDIGYGAHYDHCAYGIYYGNYSESMTVRGYESDNAIFYGSKDLFWWKGEYGNQNVSIDLTQTYGSIRFDCNGTSDTSSWGSYAGCESYIINTSKPEIFEMNCYDFYSCKDTQIYTQLGEYKQFPDQIRLNCYTADTTTCSGINIYVGDGSYCQYGLISPNGTNSYWGCVDWIQPN